MHFHELSEGLGPDMTHSAGATGSKIGFRQWI